VLFKVAPHCEAYHATDFSSESISYIKNQLIKDEPLSNIVTVSSDPAEKISKIKEKQFETVVISAVVQYFPSIHYLIDVLNNLLDNLPSGGSIFIGDIFNLENITAFRGQIQLYQSNQHQTIKQWKTNTLKRTPLEKELAISPRFFYALAQQHPKISNASVQLKRGSSHNELNCFYYDVILHVGDKTQSPKQEQIQWNNWNEVQPNTETIRNHLLEAKSKIYALRDIPNARLTGMYDIFKLADSLPDNESINTLKTRLSCPTNSVGPNELCKMAAEVGYYASITWSDHTPECMDVIFIPEPDRDLIYDRGMSDEYKPLTPKEIEKYANNPLDSYLMTNGIRQLREYLKSKIPDYMVPSHFIPLESFPLTVNGKIDREALPEPGEIILSEPLNTPCSKVEGKLIEIWEEVLGVKGISTQNNFFEVGGHSLLAVQLVTKINKTFSIDLQVATLFSRPTVFELAFEIEQLQQTKEAQTEEDLVFF